LALELKGYVDQLVFLAAYELSFSGADKDFCAGDAVAFALGVGVAEEAGVDAGVAHDQCQPVQEALLGHGGADDILGGVNDGEEVDAGMDA
jgi:hypothetical protein